MHNAASASTVVSQRMIIARSELFRFIFVLLRLIQINFPESNLVDHDRGAPVSAACQLNLSFFGHLNQGLLYLFSQGHTKLANQDTGANRRKFLDQNRELIQGQR